MTTALALAKKVAKKFPKNTTGQCQMFAGMFWEEHFGKGTPNTYASAKAAYEASKIVSKNPLEAPPGAYHYFEYPPFGHVGVALGSGLMANNTGNTAGKVADLGNHILVSDVAKYAASGRRYLGWSLTNGKRKQITGLTDANAPKLEPGQRQVLPTKALNIRKAPQVTAKLVGTIPAGRVLTPIAYLPDGATVDKVSLWYQIGEERWVWGGGCTVVSGADIPLYAPPAPPVEPEPTPEEPIVNEPEIQVHEVHVFSLAGEVTLQVADGDLIDPSLLPDPMALPEGLPPVEFKQWRRIDGDTLSDFDPATDPVTGPLTIAAAYQQVEDIPFPGEPAEPPLPVVNVDPRNLDDAAAIMIDALAPWLPSGARAKIYEVCTGFAAASATVITLASGVIAVVSLDSQVGQIAAQVALWAGIVGGVAGTVAARIARQNTPLEAAKRLAAQGDPLGVRTVEAIRSQNAAAKDL